MSDKCKKCSGSGEAFGGTCYDCGGSGEVSEVRYQTVSSSQSKNPALRYEREHPKEEFIPATKFHVEQQLKELKALVQYEVEKTEPVIVDQINCQHDFKEYRFSDMCDKCGMYTHQYHYSINAPLEVRG